MATNHIVATAAVLSLTAGTALAGIQTFDVLLDYQTTSQLGITLDQGLPTQSNSHPTSFDAFGTIAMRVSIDNGQLQSAAITGGSYNAFDSIASLINDNGTDAEVSLNDLSVNLGSAASLLQFEIRPTGLQLGFRPMSSLSGNVAAAESGTLKGSVDLADQQPTVIPQMFGYLALEGDILTFTTKFEFNGGGFDTGLTSGRDVSYDVSSEIRAIGVVPTPGSALLACGAFLIAARRKR